MNATENFSKALDKLIEFTSEAVETDRDKAGIIQAFEFTFEQSWKACQSRAKDEGLEAKSPNQSFRCALELGFIDTADEQSWLEMIKDRNLTSQTYHEDLANEIVQRVINSYVAPFQKLSSKLN